jgi:NAD+ synthase (glutamine-hydrolysing)
MDIAGCSRKNVIAITMPCFGTTERTKGNALVLADELGCSVRTIDIKAAVNQHFKDISHDETNYDVVYENAQARERTQILMDVANAEGGMVVGTGDLSELALGFATYNGDHMSMYCVNGSVPKTLMRAMIRHIADVSGKAGKNTLSEVLLDIINTPVSPELLPLCDGENNQHTEKIVGPYELHDFFLYYTVKYGYSPKKIFELATSVFTDYSQDDIRSYLDVFVRRFFSQQFKRSCLPDGPRVTEISLSPRGAWQMPSDVSSTVWRTSLL